MSNYLKKTFNKKEGQGFELLFAGDVSFGENYQERISARGQESILDKFGYDYCLQKLKPLMQSCDFVAINLETPITDLKKSPFDGQKEYIHWTDTKKTPKALIDHNTSVVSLANNHSFDYGHDGYDQTLKILKDNNLPFIGAGENIYEAAKPFICEINFGKKKFNIAIIAAFEDIKYYRDKYEVYAAVNKSGLMPLKLEFIANQINKIREIDPNTYIILFPHWGDNYKWCDETQTQMAEKLFALGVDLIIGHGAHMIQEFEKINQKLVLYNIGNFMFGSPGRYSKMQAPPYSAAAVLDVKLQSNELDISLKLYPIVSDNKITNYQPRPTTKEEIKDLEKHLIQKKITNNFYYLSELKEDKFGYYFNFSLTNEKWIGLIYHQNHNRKISKGEFNLIMYRASVLTPTLAKNNYKLICYSPNNIDKEKNIVSGYVWEDNNFKHYSVKTPKINHDFHIGPDDFDHYKNLQEWSVQKGYKLYPTKSIKRLASDKLRAAEIMSKFDQSIVPFTESFNCLPGQVEKYLKKKNLVFIKPRFGSMGEKIFVLKVENDKFKVEYYIDKEKTINSFLTLSDAINHINSIIQDEQYIIQEAIDVVRYGNSVFDIRALVFNNNGKWEFTTEARISMESREVSNNGSNRISIEILNTIYSQDKSIAILEKIKDTSINLVTFLSSECNELINELGFDVIIDKNDNIYIAEINTKSGLAGPTKYIDFFNMTEDEKYLYENLAVKHGECLARSLISRDKEITNQIKIDG